MARADRPERHDLALDRVGGWALAPRSRGFRWAFALWAFGLAFGLRAAFDPLLPAGYPFLTFFPAVAFTAIFAGAGAALTLSVASFLAAWYFFIPPARTFAINPATGAALALYVVVLATQIGAIHLMRISLARLARAEAAARETAHGRMLMFSELQHRVSNNLGVVASLLALQRRRVADPTAARALEEAERRVGVVSRLSRLLMDPEAQEVDLGAFLRAMAPEVVAAAAAEDRVAVTVRADPLSVPAARAVPLGLIATELISNALEHGFPDGRAGRIEVDLRAQGTDGARLEVRDDGAGLPDGFDLDRARSLGLIIARQFARQMGAALAMEADGGAVARLDFPLRGPEAAEA